MSPHPTRIGIDPTLMSQLINEIKRLKQSWPDIDNQIGSALRAAGTSMSGPGMLRDISFQIGERVPDLQRRLDLIIATQKIGLDKGVVWADESLWVSTSPTSGAAAAKQVADELRAARRNFPFLQRPLSDKTLDALEKHKHDPYFAIAFAKEIPPQELKKLLRDLDQAQATMLIDKDDEGPKSDAQRLLSTLGTILGTASRGVGDMKLPRGYVDELISNQSARDSSNVNELLRHGTFDDVFLRDLANKVYDNTQRSVGDQGNIIGFGSGLAAALANNSRVAQDLFADPARKPLAFLMRNNRWDDGGREMGRAIEAATTTYRDNTQPPSNSRGYKSALIASWAVHFWADKKAQWVLPKARLSAARVLSAYISDVHRTPGSGAKETMGVTPLADSDPNLPGQQPYGAQFERKALKDMMTWAFDDPEALRTVTEAHGRYSLKVVDAQAGQIKEANTKAFEDWKGNHPNATKAELAAEWQKTLEAGMISATAEEFKAKVFDLSRSLHLIVDAGNISDINKADRKDESYETFTDTLIATTKMVLTPAGDVVVAGYEGMQGNLDDAFKFEEGQKARAQAGSALTESQNMFKDLVAGAMLRHGMFGEGSTPGGTHPHASQNYAKDSPGDFLKKDGQLKPRSTMDATEEFAYTEWLGHSKASRIFSGIDSSVRSGFAPPDPKVGE
ncbi:DUF6571 family protein [Nonomuraea sp. NPDC050680]|uniref:DUF6571 family protein n=1 Tax=Nonomuraea sp. NPDC050680 TaxID=3154630 RepID=UPI0033E63C50